uniref:Uncharacterized protein n=1 Tax=Rhizophora mucronata TaxID=61149 RepID=A0A2P2P3Y2_RHIMU
MFGVVGSGHVRWDQHRNQPWRSIFCFALFFV